VGEFPVARSRKSLVASAARWFLVALLAAVVGTLSDGTDADWLSELMVYPAGVGVGWGLVNLGRATVPESWRRTKSRDVSGERRTEPGRS
jgi:hypothetical protein